VDALHYLGDQWTNHPLNNPRWVGRLRLHADAIVQRNSTGGGATADQDSDWVRVRGVLGHEDGCAFIWVCATGLGARDRTGDVWKDSGSGKRDWVKDACLVVVSCPCGLEKVVQGTGRLKLTNEYATARKDMKEGIEIVWLCPLKPVKEDLRVATRNTGENLKRRVASGACAFLTTHNEDTAISHDKGCRIPTPTLHGKFPEYRYA